jgi:hypothetical protein
MGLAWRRVELIGCDLDERPGDRAASIAIQE